MLEKILESLLDCKEIKPVNSKGNQPLIFFGRSDRSEERRVGKEWDLQRVRLTRSQI